MQGEVEGCAGVGMQCEGCAGRGVHATSTKPLCLLSHLASSTFLPQIGSPVEPEAYHCDFLAHSESPEIHLSGVPHC